MLKDKRVHTAILRIVASLKSTTAVAPIQQEGINEELAAVLGGGAHSNTRSESGMKLAKKKNSIFKK